MATADLTAQRLRELLDYDPETGVFTRLSGPKAGSAAGSPQTKGYIQILVDGRFYVAHRLALLYVNGVWPTNQVDHINGKKNDNRFSNLRDVDQVTNMQNFRVAKPSKLSCGLLGAFRDRGRWVAKIQVDGKQARLGTFGTAEEAHAAYLDAKRSLHAGCTI